MKDLSIHLGNRLGALAEMGEALGRAGVSVEGSGVFVSGGAGIAHFLFRDGRAAREALEAAGIRVVAEKEVLMQKLRQGEPGGSSGRSPDGWQMPGSTSRCSTAITITS